MYKLIEWNSSIYYWVIIIDDNSKIVEVIKDIEHSNSDYITTFKIGNFYKCERGKQPYEKVLAKSKSLEKLKEIAHLHIL